MRYRRIYLDICQSCERSRARSSVFRRELRNPMKAIPCKHVIRRKRTIDINVGKAGKSRCASSKTDSR